MSPDADRRWLPTRLPEAGGRDRGEATMKVWPEVRASGLSADLQPCEILPNAWGLTGCRKQSWTHCRRLVRISLT
jgi:hypothetical protein